MEFGIREILPIDDRVRRALGELSTSSLLLVESAISSWITWLCIAMHSARPLMQRRCENAREDA